MLRAYLELCSEERVSRQANHGLEDTIDVQETHL